MRVPLLALLPLLAFRGSALAFHAANAPAARLVRARSPSALVEGTSAELLPYFAAGGLCAAISHSIATPIDVVKTRKQTVPAYRNASLLDGLALVVKEEGAPALLTGLGPTAVGYGLEGALKFGCYESIKAPMAELLGAVGADGSSSALGPILAAVLAGGLASVVLAPAEATRIRLVSDPRFAGVGTLDAASRIIAQDGAAGLFRGVPATFLKQMPYTATKQVTFDALIDAAATYSAAPGAAALLLPRWASTAAAAATAAVLSTLASQPGDAILSEVSRSCSGDACDDRSLGGAVERLGGAGLARGLRARLVHVGVIVTVQLVLYDTLKHAFGVP